MPSCWLMPIHSAAVMPFMDLLARQHQLGSPTNCMGRKPMGPNYIRTTVVNAYSMGPENREGASGSGDDVPLMVSINSIKRHNLVGAGRKGKSGATFGLFINCETVS